MSVNGIGQNYYQNNVSANQYNRSRAGQFCPQKQAAEESAPEGTRQNADVQDIYGALKSTNPLMGQEESTISNDSSLTVWYGDKTLEEWAATDPKYTDKETGFSWYVRDGKHPYMTGEDAEKFKQMCKETGESWLKKFAEMTGTIQHLDDNTTAFVGTNGTVIKSKDGKELEIDTSSMTYDMIMNMFKNLPKSGNYLDSSYWQLQGGTAKATDYDEKAFEMVGRGAPQEVKDAWMDAAKEVNANGMGVRGNGMMSHISQMMVQRLNKQLKGETENFGILGSTVESAIQAAKQALYDLEHPLAYTPRSIEVQQARIKEGEFYRAFLEKLEQL